MTMTQYTLNLLADFMLREQAYDPPATNYVGLFTVLPTRSAGGTELALSGYARVALASSLANWSGTQGAGTTAASSGSGAGADRITNNVTVTMHAAITVAWPSLVGWGLFDAVSAGNLLRFGTIVDSAGNPISRSFSIGDAVEFAPGTLEAIFA